MNTKKPLNERHWKILDYLQRYVDEKGFPPTLQEIGLEIGVKSKSLINFYLDRLQAEGFIKRQKKLSRSIVIIDLKNAAQEKVKYEQTV
jgi:repressor LexA